MIEGVTLAFILASVIIIGFLGDYLFKRTGVPDMLFLIALGMLFGSVLGVFNSASIMSLAPYIATLSFVVILFDGGLRMSIYKVFSESPRVVLLAVLGFLFALVAVALFMHYAMGLPLLYAVLFGAIFGGGGSSVAVLSLVDRIHMSDRCEAVLSLESVIDDILCTVGSLVIIGIIMTGYVDSATIARDIASQFSIGAIIGVAFGLAWLRALRKVVKVPYTYMLTLAVVFLAYSVAEYLGGNGALSSLIFGIVLGNEGEISRILNRKPESSVIVDAGLRQFEKEVAFFIRSFFFVYLGLLAVAIDVDSLFWGVVLSFLLLFLRFGAVRLATIRSPLCEERSIMSVMLIRGLVAAILATIPMQYDLPYADLYLNITLVVIISTAVFSTVGVVLVSRARARAQETEVQQDKQKPT
ncbi:MAG: cation:proton antiporter [Candidatus Bathyarchaeota archaeon]